MTEQLFSVWLKQQLNTRTMSGGELAQKARISRAAAYTYLDGSRTPSEVVVKKLTAALNVPEDAVPPFKRKPIGRPVTGRTVTPPRV